MAKNNIYLAVGEEAARGTGEVTTVGFVPLNSQSMPEEIDTVDNRTEFRGEDTILGATTPLLRQTAWTATVETPMFTEAGTTVGMIGTFFKHCFGKVVSAQNGATLQYLHMFYPVDGPFETANLGDKALTLNYNINEGAVQKNYPYLGGRVNGFTITSETATSMITSFDMTGQSRDTVTAELGSVVMPEENLRIDYENTKIYTGTIVRTGTAPDYTDFTFGSATQICPDSFTITASRNSEDVLRLCGANTSDKTRMGQWTLTVEMTIDWEDPSSGFSSVDDFNDWINNPTNTTNLFLHSDTGTQAGTGDNHQLYVDMPKLRRTGGNPEYNIDSDPMVTLTYEGLFDDTTTEYIIGLMLKNTAVTV